MHKFPSISSIHSMASLGYLPPGHGYIPKKPKPDKPYGPSFVTVMNRSWRGPGRKYLRRYALGCLCTAIIFYTSAALYFGHRNVFRLIVRHSEPMGSILLMIAILFTGGMFYYVWKANLESNRWRSHVRVGRQYEYGHIGSPTLATSKCDDSNENAIGISCSFNISLTMWL